MHKAIQLLVLAVIAGLCLESDSGLAQTRSETFTFGAPSFPGAQGGGAISWGGRAGSVIMVTNLNDSGTGSLRACIIASGPRTCIFRVGGTIAPSSQYTFNNGSITIAGQSAPGGGIQIVGTNLPNSNELNMFEIHASDVVIRYIKLRIGVRSGGWSCSECARNLLALDGVRQIYDHMSSQWNWDDNLAVWAHSTMTDWTNSNSILGEALTPEGGKCQIIGANGSTLNGMRRIDTHHNLFTTCEARSPYNSTFESKVVSNIVYNWGNEAGNMFRGGLRVDVISNLYRGGPESDGGSNPKDILHFPYSGSSCEQSTYCINGDPSIYVSNNVFTINGTQTNPATDNWPQLGGWNGGDVYSLPTSYRRTSPLAADTFPISTQDPRTLPASILPTVGASRRVDCNGAWVINRDSADTRMVNNYNNGTGNTFANQSAVGGYPTISAGTACADADLDGMPDAYETAKGLNPNDASDRNGDQDNNGFTNLEDYLEGE